MSLSNTIITQIKRISRNLIVANSIFLIFALYLDAYHLIPIPYGSELLILFALFNISKGLLRLFKKEWSPIVKALAKYDDPVTVSQELENELLSDSQEYDTAKLTPHWYFRPTLFGLDIIKLDDVVWAYEKVKTKQRKGVKETDYIIILNRKDGTTYEVPLLGSQTTEFLKRVAASTPAAAIGYSTEVQMMWEKDKPGFVRLIESRRHNPISR